jgi:hypothetical protein
MVLVATTWNVAVIVAMWGLYVRPPRSPFLPIFFLGCRPCYFCPLCDLLIHGLLDNNDHM